MVNAQYGRLFVTNVIESMNGKITIPEEILCHDYSILAVG